MNPGRRIASFSVILAFVLSAVAMSAEEKPEIVSLLGKKCYATPAQGDELQKLLKDLDEAKKNLDQNPNDVEAVIMYGRRLAYLWRYHEAIDVFTRGLERWPENAMLYRHRGHRYISIRSFDRAAADLERASELNDHDFDIWYHLGLARYRKGEFSQAEQAYGRCLRCARDDDSLIAVSNWLFITLRRLGLKDQAAKVLEGIKEGMKVVENQSYYDLLFLYKGLKTEPDLEKSSRASELDFSTIGYGLGCWNLYNGNATKAKTYFREVVEGKYWPAFGFIAAEAELARNK